MPSGSLRDHQVLPRLAEVVARDRETTAEMLVLIVQADARRLYAGEGFPSMFAYCVRELRMSEDVAFSRIRAARLARRYPAILPALVEGRLHLTALRHLAPHLTRENAAELLAAAEHRSRRELEQLLATRFPRPDIPTVLAPLAPVPLPDPVAASVSKAPCEPVAAASPVPGRVEITGVSGDLRPEPAVSPVPEPVALPPAATWLAVSALSPQRYALRATIGEETAELLERAKGLLAHVMPGANLADVLERVLRDWVLAKERQKHGLTQKPRRGKVARSKRYIPARVKRAVWRRDGGRCTFVGRNDRRCEAVTHLEYDHIIPESRGGRATVKNLRLRCRCHNQLEAERVFGAAFMAERRERRAAGKSPGAANPMRRGRCATALPRLEGQVEADSGQDADKHCDRAWRG